MKLLALTLFCSVNYIGFSQSSDWFKTLLTSHKNSTYSRLSYTYSDENCSDVYAVTMSNNKTIIVNACTEKVEHDTLDQINNKGHIFIGSNEHFHFLINDEIINKSGWKPIKINKASFDTIVYLDFHDCLAFKGNQKWILNLDLLLEDPFNFQKIDFIGKEFIHFNGGLIVQTNDSGIKKYRYVQYSDRVTGYDDNGETIYDPNFHYLAPDMKFEADSILLHNYNEEVMLISNNDSIYVYSFCNDEVLEKDINKYYLSNPLVIIQEEYIAYPDGCIWKKLDIPNVISIDFDNEGGDSLIGLAKTSTGQTFKIDFFSGEFQKY